MHFPASFGQRRLWFLDQLNPGEATYNMPYALWLDGPLDAPALQRAMDALAARQAVLRTRLVAIDGLPEQVVDDAGPLPIERIELPEGLDDGERTRQARSIAVDRGCRPFDLAGGPLIRATLVAAGPDWHVLVLVMHHSISDGATVDILAGELSALYRAEVTGTPAALPELWMEYGDYAVWQQERMRGEELDRLLSYWRERLRGAPQVVPLPADRPRPARQSSDGGLAKAIVDLETTRRLAALAQTVNATRFMVFLAGYVAVLARYVRQTDLVLDTQVSGRSHAELDSIAGMFTNTVPLRVSLAGDPTFAELIERVRDTTLDAMRYSDLPFEVLVEELAPDRTLSYSALTQVQFVHGSLTPPVLDLPGITSRSEALLTNTSKLDVTLYADTLDDQATKLVLEYSTDLFGPAWADRFLRCTVHLLEAAASAPGTPVADLPMLTAAERDELIIGRNRPAVLAGRELRPAAVPAGRELRPAAVPAGRELRPAAVPTGGDLEIDVRGLLQASASRVFDGGGEVPMSTVCDRAARIARVLAGHGAGPDTLVGLCVERGTGMLTALLGTWWAGGAYVPLDTGYPQARLTTMAHGAGLRLILADSGHRDLAKSVAGAAEVICIDDPQITAAAPLAPVPVPGSALAYVIFTSGSTGQPKGVGVGHRGVTNLLASFRRVFSLRPGDRFVSVTTLSFDIALVELLLPVICGAGLVIATAAEAREPDRLRALIERAGATAMQATPQTWRMLESAGGVPAGVRLRMSGGETLTPDLAAQLMAPGVTLWNGYGPTETTVYSAAGFVTSAATAPHLGPPVDHTRVYILDERLMPVPAGVIGEVCLAGRGVARGYYGRPRLTARSFRPDPWSDEPGARMYRTGDLGRWLDGGGLELIGRNDHQVKIRGFRIECGEIEAVLRKHRDVRQAVVVTADRAGEPALVAYVVPRRGSAVAQPGASPLEELRPHLRAALPDYMIPALVVALPALPLTPNAKVDRSALPAPQWGAPAAATGRVEPRNPVEATFARIWTDLLATEELPGVHDNLFALGGHSLTATRFVARVQDAYGVSLPVHCVFASPTIAELAELVAADPAFGQVATSSRHADLDDLSDEELDDLLRAVLAQRHRRQAAGGTGS